MALYNGTSGSDEITGDQDPITGLPGTFPDSDTINGGAGDDTLSGLELDDVLVMA